jgi:D-3-phosphoglycerate dehydrogenase
MPATLPTIAITDWTFPDLSIEEGILKPAGFHVAARQCKTEAEVIDLCAEADAVITQFARISHPVIAALRKARAVVRYGIGVDNIDLEAAHARGIPSATFPTTASTRWLTKRWHSSWPRRGKW